MSVKLLNCHPTEAFRLRNRKEEQQVERAAARPEQDYLECEKGRTFVLLMFVGGFFGAFTYSVRGGVFCNAQTANFVLSAMALGSGNWKKFLYYLIPMTAYFLGAVVSESVPKTVRSRLHIRWDTLFILLEMGFVAVLGLIPESAPYQISQVMVNFIASMQYNTFRQSQSVPMATTFCTNHLRQVGVAFSKLVRHRDPVHLTRMLQHCRMLLSFVLGGVAAPVLSRLFLGRAMFFALIPLAVLFLELLRDDLSAGEERLNRKPRGH